MIKNMADALMKLGPFTAEEQKVVDKLIATEKLRSDAKKEDSAKPRKPSSHFTVIVDDNYHYMDKDHRYTAGEFDTWEEAVAKAREMVDSDIVAAIENGSTPEEAIEQYLTFGEDPWITGDGDIPDGDFFCAWSYAKARSKELYELKQRPKKTGEPRKIDCPTEEKRLNAKETTDNPTKDSEAYSRSIQPVWDELMKDKLISGMVRDSLISSGMMGSLTKNLNANVLKEEDHLGKDNSTKGKKVYSHPRSIQPIWDKMVENEELSKMITDSLKDAEKPVKSKKG
jgi:hypothetical protein